MMCLHNNKTARLLSGAYVLRDEIDWGSRPFVSSPCDGRAHSSIVCEREYKYLLFRTSPIKRRWPESLISLCASLNCITISNFLLNDLEAGSKEVWLFFVVLEPVSPSILLNGLLPARLFWHIFSINANESSFPSHLKMISHVFID
jgi:hypothetical protein